MVLEISIFSEIIIKKQIVANYSLNHLLKAGIPSLLFVSLNPHYFKTKQTPEYYLFLIQESITLDLSI